MGKTTTVTVQMTAATAVLNQLADRSRKHTAKSASAKIPRTKVELTLTVRVNVRTPVTRVMATATMPTTSVAVIMTAATAVNKLSLAELSRKITARCASAKIPNTNPKPTLTAKEPVAMASTRPTATATMKTTTAAVITTAATAAVQTLKNPTVKSASAKIPITSLPPAIAKERAVRRSTKASATITTTIVAVVLTGATAALGQRREAKSTRL